MRRREGVGVFNIATKEGWTWHLSDFPQILIYDVFCRVYEGIRLISPSKQSGCHWKRIVNFGHFGQKLDHRKLDFLFFDVVYRVAHKEMYKISPLG